MKKREIGSDFWDIPICEKENDIFPKDTKWFVAGRTALSYIIKDSGIKSVSMPAWCCESMINPFKDNDVAVEFYDTTPSKNCDAVLIMDYFGFTNHFKVPTDYKGIVIRDVTHSVFSKKYDDADYYYGSLRKWAGFVTGGFAWGNWKKDLPIPECDNDYVALKKQAMLDKKKYIDRLTDSKDYLALFKKANETLLTFGIMGASEEDVFCARHLDVDYIKSKRRNNAKILIKHFGCLYYLNENDCPLFVPIYVRNRDVLRETFISNNMFFPVHWPNHDLNGRELSIVCDQRYDEEDMLEICKVANSVTNK